MKIERVCQIHEKFQREWKRDFPNGPLPVLDCIDDAIKRGQTDDANSSFCSGLVSSVQERLVSVNNKINLIREQLLREVVVKQFLIRVLDILDRTIDSSAQLTKIYDQISFLNDWQSPQSLTGNIDKTLGSKLNYFESFKLNSIERKPAERSNTLPKFCYSNQNRTRQFINNDNKSSDICGNLEETVENDEMFNKKKRNITKGNEGEARSSVLGGKDNFLAVKSKNIASNVATRQQDLSNAGSPNLSRHFQMLQLTDGFDLVLGDTPVGDGGELKGEVHRKYSGVNSKPDIISEHQNLSQKLPLQLEKNRKEDSSKLKQQTEYIENVTTIKIEKSKFYTYDGTETGLKVDGSEVIHTKQTLKEESDTTLLLRPRQASVRDGSLGQDHIQHVLNQSEDQLEHSNSFQDKLRKFSVKGVAAPPPVARKPARAGSGNKPPNSSAELPPPNSSSNDHISSSPASGVPISQSLAEINNPNNKVFNRSKSEDGTCNSVEKGSDFDGVINTTQIYVQKRRDLSTRHSGTDSPVINDIPITNNVTESRERVVVRHEITGEEHNVSEMNYLLKKSGNSSHRNSLENLVEGIGYNMVNIHKSVEDVSKSSANDVPPKVPSRRPISSSKESDYYDSTKGDVYDHHVVTSSNRKELESSVFDDESNSTISVQNISYKNVNQSGSTKVDLSPMSKKRLSSTPNYENWTINRAITISSADCLSASDDDELDDAPLSPVPPSPSMEQQTASIGSKDSGLCEDINSSELSRSNLDIVTARSRQEPRTVPPVNRQILHVDEQTLNEMVCLETDFTNGVSPARALEVGHREDDVTETLSVDRLSVDTYSMHSDGEEEASPSMDTSLEVTDSVTDGMLKMRQLLVKGVLDSEKSYLGILSLLIDYKRSLEASSMSSQPVISKEDIQTIFSIIETVSDIHTEFVDSLATKVNNWSHGESVGEIFKIMISKMIKFGNYLNNYHQAVSTIHKCCQESEQFDKLAKHITVNSTVKEITSLEDALFKPVQRVQRNTLVLHDLIKYTPENHPDHHSLQKALKLSHQIIQNFAPLIPQSSNKQDNHRLVKSSFLVEDVCGVRKLRYIFLFSDVLVCTKREIRRNNKVTFDIKWFAPLSHSTIDTKFQYSDDGKSSKDDIGELKTKLKSLKRELKLEMRKSDDKDRHRGLVSLGGGASRTVEKYQKKINQTEAQLILASPKLPFKVLIDGGRSYTLLMSTDYEREEWKETISALFKKVSKGDNSPNTMSSIFIQELINNVKETPQVNKIGNVLLKKDQDMLTGILNVTIHKVNGLTEPCDTYCNLEMDSFGHFFFKARTTICERTQDPAWNEDFDLELEGSETLRILCFKKVLGAEGDKLLGRGALELNSQWLKGAFQEKTISMNEISLVISMRHIPADKTMQRTPSRTNSAVFGVSISSCAKREGKTVPMIVTACVQEVEKRGIDEVGIYRVSGVSSDLQNIKKLIDKNARAGTMMLQDADIHSVTGVLKLYLRELPEPLFTEANYQSFVDTLKLSDDEAKSQCMLALLHGLPDTNYYTIVYLLEHLIKVAKQVGVNKMSIHNLSTIFGPTLLAPATKQTSNDPLEMMFKGAEEVMQQSSVVNYLLGLAFSGRSLRRSAQ